MRCSSFTGINTGATSGMANPDPFLHANPITTVGCAV